MKKLLFLIELLLFVNYFVFAQGTSVPGGEVSGIWTKANSPYLIQGAIMIANDSTLTIEPGVSVIFQGGYKFLVLGRLLAVGTLSDSITFTAADTATGWRGIRFDNTSSTNDTSKFFYCKLTYGKVSGSSWDCNGGALFIKGFTKINISNCNIIKNSASGHGGGVYIYEGSPIIKYTTINYNLSSNNGGGIFSYNSKITITNSTISYNSSTYGGGGIYCYKNRPLLELNIISYNSTSTWQTVTGGGGIYSFGCKAEILNNMIYNNTTEGYGGGIYSVYSNSIISNNIISYNKTTDNFSDFCGGGIYSDNKDTIIENIISNNYSGSGGGIGCQNSLMIENNLISNNKAKNYGGGVITSGNSIFNNNLIINNDAPNGGGVSCNYMDSTTFNNNTICGNEASNGGGLYCMNNSNPNFINNIMWGNIAINGNQVFLFDEDSDPFFNYCDLKGGKVAFGLNNVFYLGTYTNNIDTDPIFADTSTADWSLQSTSPCINAGDSLGTYPSTDKVGNPRICDGRIDIGAYEFQKSPCNTVNVSMDKSENQISIFPNPTCEKFQLVIGNMQLAKVQLTIYNVFGENVFQSEIFNPISEIDVSGLSDQIYLVRVKINEQVLLRKICKIR